MPQAPAATVAMICVSLIVWKISYSLAQNEFQSIYLCYPNQPRSASFTVLVPSETGEVPHIRAAGK